MDSGRARVPRRFAIPEGSWRLPGGLALEVYQPDGADSLHAHTHPVHCINIVLDGILLETRGTTTYELRAGAISLLPAATSHAVGVRGRGARVVHLEFGPEFLARLPERWRDLANVPPLLDDASRALAERFRVELLSADSLSTAALEILSHEALLQLLRAAQPAPPQIPERLRELLLKLQADPSQQVHLATLARSLGTTPRALSQSFRRHFGQSLPDHMVGLRMQAACAALIESDRPLALIADQLGFADQSHFTRVFRRQIGETPRRYRERRSQGA